MMVTKLQSEGSEALARSCKPNFEFLDDISKEQMELLSETERRDYILRKNELDDYIKAIFRG